MHGEDTLTRGTIMTKKYADRYNEGKPQYSYIDLNCLKDCAKVLEFGATKYTRNNWKKGMRLNSILDSLMRHISAIQRGEFVDPESGHSHIGHIQCNAMFLGNPNLEIDIEEDNFNNFLGIHDDR